MRAATRSEKRATLSESKVREIAAFAKVETATKESAVKKKAKVKTVQSAVGLQYASALSDSEWAQKLTLYYATEAKSLPVILGKEGKELPLAVKVWLLTVHEKTIKHPWNEVEVLVDYTYAQIRGTDADTIRDKYLPDVGLDEQGGKTYDLGNQTVTARLQKDLSFLIELPTGKAAKSLPKKGADADKYAAANTDFSEMKKNTKKIAKSRVNILYSDFLSGRTREADAWKESCLKNPLLRQVSSLLVWTQGGRTFTLTDVSSITADGVDYTIGDGEIALAHPMDMSQTDLSAWQKYFAANGIKQPFEQIWEPVVDAASITEDRYKDCMIPYYRFAGQKKHGIHVEDTDFHNSIYIYFDDCKANVKRIDQMRHAIEMDHRFEVRNISFEKYSRKVNHIIAYLDRVTIFERIKKDDVGIAAFLPSFTLAQITEFIKVAAENNCTNVTAILLDYKNQNFADFDPMEEFSLEL